MVPSQQEKIHAHSFVLGPESRIQYTHIRGVELLSSILPGHDDAVREGRAHGWPAA